MRKVEETRMQAVDDAVGIVVVVTVDNIATAVVATVGTQPR